MRISEYNYYFTNFNSPSNPIRRNTTRARGRSYKKEKVLQHTVPNTPNSVNVMSNMFRFDQALKKQQTIF